MNDNPFVDPSDVNPFEDLSRGNNEAVLEIDDRLDNPFHDSNRSQNLSGNIQSSQITNTTNDLRSRQEELDRREAELREREERLNQNTLPKVKNWPPLPDWCPLVKPCFYHDIDMEIPRDFQPVVRKMYHVWIYYVIIMFVNFFVHLVILFIPNATKEEPTPAPVTKAVATTILETSTAQLTTNTTTGPNLEPKNLQQLIENETPITRERRSTDTIDDLCKPTQELYLVWVSLLWFLIFTPASVIWYRAIYKAFRDDSSFQFFLFFFIYFFQLIFHIIQAIGASDMGFAGWIQVFNFMKCSLVQGLLVLLPAIGFTSLCVICLMQMMRIHEIYKASGKSLKQAQDEWATGVANNENVQNFARNAASEIGRSQINSFGKS